MVKVVMSEPEKQHSFFEKLKGVLRKSKKSTGEVESSSKYFNVVFFSNHIGPYMMNRKNPRLVEQWQYDAKSGKKEPCYITSPEVTEIFLKHGIRVVGTSRSNMHSLYEDLRREHVDAVISDPIDIGKNEGEQGFFSGRLTFQNLKRKFKFALIAVEDRKKMFDNDRPDKYLDCVDHFINISLDSLHHNPFQISDVLSNAYEFIRHYKPDSEKTKLKDYLFNLFASVPPEILEKLVDQLDHNIKHVSSITNKTFANAVGSISFSLDGKRYVFKVYNKQQYSHAKTELKIGKVISQDEELKQVCARFRFLEGQTSPLEYKGYYLILTEDINHKSGSAVSSLEKN